MEGVESPELKIKEHSSLVLLVLSLCDIGQVSAIPKQSLTISVSSSASSHSHSITM